MNVISIYVKISYVLSLISRVCYTLYQYMMFIQQYLQDVETKDNLVNLAAFLY